MGGGGVYKGMEHVNSGMELMCQRGIIHASCIPNPKRKQMVHKRKKVDDESSENRRKGANSCDTDRESTVSHDRYKNRKCKPWAGH